MGRRPFRDGVERAFGLGGLIAAACLPLALYFVRWLLRIPTREEREWAEIEEALHGPNASGAAAREAAP